MEPIKTKRYLKILSIILSVAMLVQSIPMTVNAQIAESLLNDSVVSDSDLSSDSKIYSNEIEKSNETFDLSEIEIIGEIEELREESIKHFKTSDGSSLAVVYPQPVHTRTSANDKWKEIDNSLIKSTEGGKSVIKNKENSDFQVSFAENASTDAILNISDGNRSVSMSLNSSKKASTTAKIQEDTVAEPSAQITSSKTVEEKLTEKENKNLEILSVDNISSTLKYENILPKTDFVYTVSPEGVKEDIIVKAPQSSYEYVFSLDAGNMTAVKNDDNSISLFDGNEEAFVIAAPIMRDAAGEFSFALTQELVPTTSGITVKLTADSSWLNDPNRQFPVTIDPTISISQEEANITSTYVDSRTPNAVNSSSNYLCVGRSSSAGDNGAMRTYVRVNLPTLPKGSVVNYALFGMNQFGYIPGDTSEEMYMTVHQVTSAWTKGTITWNNQPTYDYEATDYVEYYYNAPNSKYWNITSIAKEWFESGDKNYGFMLKSSNESVAKRESFYANSGVFPTAYFHYVNNSGLEDYWSYSTFNVGRAGTAYVNDYSGNLVFVHDNVATSGMNLPVTLSSVHNGYMDNTYLQLGESGELQQGAGWIFNLRQTVQVTPENDGDYWMNNEYPYIYTDGDGTEHYFMGIEDNNEVKLCDEDGLGLELKKNGNSLYGKTYSITDKKDNVMQFRYDGYLTKIEDANENSVTITYESFFSKRIKEITDGAGHTLTLVSKVSDTGNYYLDKIVDPAGRETKFTYDTSLLAKITYPDGTETTFTYDEDNALETVGSSDGYKIKFYYTSSAMGKRVTAVREFGGGVIGQTVTFDYSKHNMTTIRNSGADSVFNNSDDIITTMQFDNYGRAVSSSSRVVDGAHIGATVTHYTAAKPADDGSDYQKLNRVTAQAGVGKNYPNIAINGAAERDGNWTSHAWNNGTVSYTFERTTAQEYNGAYSFKLNTPSAFSGNTGARIYQSFSTSVLVPGRTYTASAYVKTQGVEKANNNSGDYGACLVFQTTDGTAVYSEALNGTTDTSIDGGWRRLSATITLPEDGDYTGTILSLYLRNATGTAYFDNIQVEQCATASDYNLVENGSFENGLSRWNFTNRGSSDQTSTERQQGELGYRMYGDRSVIKEIYQDIPVKGDENDTYILSGWGYTTNAAPLKSINNSTSRNFDLIARIYYTDGSSKVKSPVPFNNDVSDVWQYTCGVFNLSDETDTNKTPEKIRVYARYNNQCNIAYFDNIQLIKDDVPTYTYNDKGELVNVVSNSKNNSTLEYNYNNDLVNEIDVNGYSYSYEYDYNHNLVSATSQRNVKYAFNVNSYGVTTGVTASNSDETMSIRTNQTVTWDSAYVINTKDQHGKITIYDYNTTIGVLNSVTGPDGVTTSYSYDEDNDAIESVTTNDTTINYTYNSKNQLSKINHNGFDYRFTYDNYGNRLQTKVGNTVLSTYEYAVNNGPLTKMTYGNGNTIEYISDALGRISYKKFNNVTRYRWRYDSSNRATVYEDLYNHLRYQDTSDSLGRLIRSSIVDTSVANGNERTAFSMELGYDQKNNIERLTYIAGGRTMTSLYSYGRDNLPESHTMYGSRKQTYSFDGLNRLSSMTINADDEIKVNYLYKMSERNESGQTTYRTTQLGSETIKNTAYGYDYDVMGRITRIREGVRTDANGTGGNYVEKVSYKYDSLGQLIRENNLYNNKTVVYNYDGGGNILEKIEYPYSAGVLGTPTATYTYTYGNNEWDDLLTEYNGQTITYDAIGNPLSYRGYTMTWDGRQLATLSGNGISSAGYRYDANGLRVSKTVNGNKTDFHYVNGLLMHEKRSDIDVYYTYDSSGNLSSIRYRYPNLTTDSYYLVVCNSRGDVSDIYAPDGTLRARYTYDAWGNIISIKDGDGNPVSPNNTYHVGNVNSIRYRGYYYDTETGRYYCQGRYYDPEVGRFINADSYIQTPNGDMTSTNMFAYCGNNPVNRYDPNGEAFLTATICGIAVWKIAAAFIGTLFVGAATYAVTDSLVKNPPVLPSISLPKIDIKPKSDSKEKDVAPTLPKPPAKDPVHHIVAKADPRAAESRQILRDVGIEPVTDPRNLVVLPQSYHASLHTTAYHNYITERLRPVAGDKAGVEATLASLKAEILARSAAGIRWD